LLLLGLLTVSIITLEDVLESLLQEQIYDESDKYQRDANRIAKWVSLKWKNYVRRRKRERDSPREAANNLSMGTVVEQAMAANETTQLLGNGTNADNPQDVGFDPIGGMMKFFDNLGKTSQE